MELLVFILLSYSISNIIVFGSIFSGFRNFCERLSPNFFGKLFNCMMCTPFWVGFVLSITFNLLGYGFMSPLYSLGVDSLFLVLFLDSCLASGTTWLLHTSQEMFERAFSNEV
jgi:hypothetical protein